MVSLVSSDTFPFADGSTGHVCNLGSSPSVGHWDVLCANSDTTVSTPAGFTLARSNVGNQGAYMFIRKAVGGEGSTVTVTTAGNFNCQVSWSRWSGVNLADTATSTTAGGAGSSTPAHSTGALSATNELVIAFGALHSISATPNTPVWSAGYTSVTSAAQGSGGAGVIGYVGYKTGAGTASESPSVSWSGGTADDRYILVVTFTTAGGDINQAVTPATETNTAVTPGRTKSRQVGPAIETNVAVGPEGAARIFRPPTYPIAYPHKPPVLPFWRYWTLPQGAAVMVQGETVTLQMYPYQGDLANFDRVYLGGYEHQITTAEAAILIAAGYGEYIE